MKNKIILIAIATTISLTGCLSAKVSHKSEVKAATASNVEKQAEAKVNDDLQTQIYQGSVDTNVSIIGGYGADTVSGVDTPLLPVAHSWYPSSGYHAAKPIKAYKNVQNASATAMYNPATGKLYLELLVRDTTIKVAENFTKTSISEHKTSNIDSSSKKAATTKTDVKSSTSVGLSAFQMPWMTWVYVVIALVVGIVIGRKTKQA